MMASDPAVKTGIWTNYELSGGFYILCTVSNIWGTIFKVLLGVIFGLSWPGARTILQRSWLWLTWLWPWPWPRSWLKKLLGGISWPWPRLGTWLKNHLGGISWPWPWPISWFTVPWQFLKSKAQCFWRGPRWYDGEGEHDPNLDDERQPLLLNHVQLEIMPKRAPLVKSDVVMVVITGLAAVLYAVAGGAIGEIPADTLGRTDTSESACGLWELRNDVDERVIDFDERIMGQKEARAADYGRDCYGSHSVYTPGRCEFFDTSQIGYTVEAVDCPFKCTKDQCICANGSFKTARRLSTGSFSAGKLGLNGRDLPFIRRTSTFVPLDINSGFVVGSGKGLYKYYLGPVGDKDYTFDTWGDPFEWDISAYSVSVYESTDSPENDYWQPIKELNRTKDSYMTAIFIQPCRIAYSGSCEDPIFSAMDDLGDMDMPNWFRRKDTRARVLIAIDEIEICRQQDKHCYPPSERNETWGIEYEFVRNALRRTSTYQSIQYRLGDALVASESLGDFFSPQLDKNQWIIESQGLFNTSLARLQFNLLDMATGNHPTGAAAEGFESAYENTTPEWAQGKMGRMCDNYKFHMSGSYINIRFSYALALLLVPLVLFVLSRDTKAPLWDNNNPPQFMGYYMIFDRIIRCVWPGAKAKEPRYRVSSSLESGTQEPESQEPGSQEPERQEPGLSRSQESDSQRSESRRAEPRETESHDGPSG